MQLDQLKEDLFSIIKSENLTMITEEELKYYISLQLDNINELSHQNFKFQYLNELKEAIECHFDSSTIKKQITIIFNNINLD
jgi:hypothetical protein